jgi:hypothetical protein
LKVYKQVQTAELLFASGIHKSAQRFSTWKVGLHLAARGELVHLELLGCMCT